MGEFKDFTFTSDYGKLEISAVSIMPDGEIKGVIQLLHGMCEYKERYKNFMSYMADHGYAVYIHDHRGHGKSINEEFVLGYMGPEGATALVEDAHKLTTIIKKEIDVKALNIPYILMGHSMGTLVARNYIKKYDGEIDKLVISGCPARLPGLAFSGIVTGVFNKKGHEKDHNKKLDNIMLINNYDKKMEEYKNKRKLNAWINSDPALVEEYNEDPGTGFPFTVNGYVELSKITRGTYSSRGWGMKNPDLPIFFASGEDDPCALGHKGFEKAMAFLRKRGYKNVAGKMYTGMRHEILNENDKNRVYQDIYDFIEK